jgi:phosphatidylserine decarboxylase
MEIIYIDRVTKKRDVEDVYGGQALRFLYGKDLVSQIFGTALLHSFVKYSPFSAMYGLWQKTSCSKKKIRPFIDHFKVDENEFLKSVDHFNSFNDFFIRKLKPEARPLDSGKDVAVIPADGRYYFYQNIEEADGFVVKERKFNLAKLLENKELAEKYCNGSMLIARLCPTDYHRFHFPCDCIPGPTRLINGWLYSVNPIAIKQNLNIFTENKRTLCELESDIFGKVIFMEIGATNVGSIIETYTPGRFYPKGAEKGYFSFGGSALILLFEPGKIRFDQDLIEATQEGLEIKCLLGQSLGRSGVR